MNYIDKANRLKKIIGVLESKMDESKNLNIIDDSKIEVKALLIR
jgi:hypothetical protein